MNREIIEAMAFVERYGRRNQPGDGGITLADMAGQHIVNDRATGEKIYVPDVITAAVA